MNTLFVRWVQEGGLLRAAHHDVPCDLIKQSWGGSGRAEHLLSTFMDPGSLLVNTKRRRDTQQQGTISFRDFQLNSLFKKSETIRCEEVTEHVGPSPEGALGALPWACPSTISICIPQNTDTLAMHITVKTKLK